MADGPFVRPKATKVGSVKIPHVITESTQETVRIDDTGTYQYFGKAPIATAGSTAAWQISRLTVANPQSLLWADGDSDYDNVWDNHASLSYS